MGERFDCGAIGVRVRTVREARGLTQKELAQRVGITQGALSNYERGKRDMAVSTVIAIAEALDVPVSQIVGEKE